MPTITKLYSMEEAAEHNTREDCWIVIDGKVYDVSTYLDEHPGGDDALLEVTGKDATEEFEDAGHSNDARVLMEEYCIGELDSPPVPAPKIMSKEELDNFPLKVLNLGKHYWYIPVAAIGLSVAVGILLRRRN